MYRYLLFHASCCLAAWLAKNLIFVRNWFWDKTCRNVCLSVFRKSLTPKFYKPNIIGFWVKKTPNNHPDISLLINLNFHSLDIINFRIMTFTIRKSFQISYPLKLKYVIDYFLKDRKSNFLLH